MENQKRICVAICFGSSNHFTGLYKMSYKRAFICVNTSTDLCHYINQRTIGPENAHLKPDPAVLSHHKMTLTLNTHTPLLNS